MAIKLNNFDCFINLNGDAAFGCVRNETWKVFNLVILVVHLG
jgi:hypothetical protein